MRFVTTPLGSETARFAYDALCLLHHQVFRSTSNDSLEDWIITVPRGRKKVPREVVVFDNEECNVNMPPLTFEIRENGAMEYGINSSSIALRMIDFFGEWFFYTKYERRNLFQEMQGLIYSYVAGAVRQEWLHLHPKVPLYTEHGDEVRAGIVTHLYSLRRMEEHGPEPEEEGDTRRTDRVITEAFVFHAVGQVKTAIGLRLKSAAKIIRSECA